MPKAIHVTMRDGSVWSIPAQPIAEQQARYYFEKDPEGDAYEMVLADVLDDDYGLTDWAANNLDWSDVEGQARRITAPQPEYGDDWPHADLRVVDEP